MQSINRGTERVHIPTPPILEELVQDELDAYFSRKELRVSSTEDVRVPQQRCIKQQISALRNRARVPLTTNVFATWRELKNCNPDLHKLATTMLAVPSSQVSVERAFSALGLILTNRRTCLKEENLQNLLLVKLNFDLLDKI